MKINSSVIADFINWIGDVFEKLSPAAFRMLSTALPYLSPLPVAYMTANSAAIFLEMDSRIAGVLVFILEGLGLWATTELVDSFVDAIRSKNAKAWGVVIFLSVVVAAYITILVVLNVVLENLVNHKGGAYSLVLTLICFLPLLSGALNGYRKVKTEAKTSIQMAKEHQEKLDRENKVLDNEFKLKRSLIKKGINPLTGLPFAVESTNGPVRTFVTNEMTTNAPVRTTVRKSTNERPKRTNGELRTFVVETIEYSVRTNNVVPNVGDLARTVAIASNERQGIANSTEGYERFKGYCSQIRTQWISEHPEYKN